MSRMITLRMPDELVAVVDEFAKASGWSRGETLVYAVEEFCPLPPEYKSRINGAKPERKKKTVVEPKPLGSGVVESKAVVAVAPVAVQPKQAPKVIEQPADRCKCGGEFVYLSGAKRCGSCWKLAPLKS